MVDYVMKVSTGPSVELVGPETLYVQTDAPQKHDVYGARDATVWVASFADEQTACWFVRCAQMAKTDVPGIRNRA